MTNYFAPQRSAQQYARGRFFYQSQVIEHITERLALRIPLAQALDVACGTGNSTVALLAVASAVTGTDPSAAMLAQAPQNPRITYVVAPAEHLPLADASFDLVTIASAFHWLDRAAALAELRRVLRSNGWLVVYDNRFTGRMLENDAFTPWFRETYIPRYPGPYKHPVAFEAAEEAQRGWRYLGRDDLAGTFSFTLPAFIDYLASTSNLMLPIESGTATRAEIEAWLTEQLAPFYGDRATSTFLFTRPIWMLQAKAI